jgi:hypothetical protein
MMEKLAGFLALLSLSLAAAGCGTKQAIDPAFCDRVVSAALNCTYSGFTERTVGELRSMCLEGDPGSECALDAYEYDCTSYDRLLAAVRNCE